MISGHVHLLSILSWGILVYQRSMSFCCTSFYNAGKLKKQKIRYFLFCLFSLIFAILIFHLNRLTLFTSDDFTYHYVYQGYLPTSHPKRIHGILSIIESQIMMLSLNLRVTIV